MLLVIIFSPIPNVFFLSSQYKGLPLSTD
jgi:hypothetical protein